MQDKVIRNVFYSASKISKSVSQHRLFTGQPSGTPNNNNNNGASSMSKFFSEANVLPQPCGSLANHGVGPVTPGAAAGGPPPPLGGVANGAPPGTPSGAPASGQGLYRSSWNVPLSPTSDDIIPRLQVRQSAVLRGVVFLHCFLVVI